MLRKVIVSIVILVVFVDVSNAQTEENLKNINQVWSKFHQAFETLDYSLMAEIHSKDLVRISGGQRIRDYDTYINGYKVRFKQAMDNGVKNDISLRFFERINNDSVASERGIYKLVRTINQNDEQSYYGQFHVIFKKENDAWKIIMDYDSTEENTIDENDFQAAYDINDYKNFVKE